ncbi:MAG TPA: hypothetical protein VG963_28130 [Polyangiaceae bacterium]|nr:hypothetical protein [Polyangiaceae bacterium]
MSQPNVPSDLAVLLLVDISVFVRAVSRRAGACSPSIKTGPPRLG